MKLAAVDLGSNTVKYTLADVSSDGRLEVLAEDAEITRIGEGLDKNGYLLDAAMDRTFAVLSRMVGDARDKGAEQVACVATAGMRGASNASVFLDRARGELGVEVEIIDGLREAELTFRAPSAAYGDGGLLVFDVGGRSTEVIYGDSGGLKDRVSLEMGGVRLTERFLPDDPPKPEQLEQVFAHAREVLEGAPDAPDGTRMVGVSGTIVSLMGADLDLDDLGEAVKQGEGGLLTRDRIQTLFDDFASKPAKDRVRGTVLPPGRADVIVAGAAITLAALDRYGLEEITVSNRGVRFGLLFEMAGA